MFDRIITVTINPSIDATLWVDRLDFDEPTVCQRRKNYSGGKGINVSKTLMALGVLNLAMTVVGKRNVDIFEELLEEDSVNYQFIENNGAIRENLSLIFPDAQGQKLLKVNVPGFTLSDGVLDRLKIEIIKASDSFNSVLLVFAGSLPAGVTPQEYKAFILSCRNEIPGAKIVLDNDIFHLDDLRELAPFIVKPNHVELAHIFNTDKAGEKDIYKYADSLSLFIPHVLVSLGARGLLYCQNEKKLIAKVPRVCVKSTIGAGDSTLAGFIYGLNEQAMGIEEAVRYAAACGTAAVTLEGTQTISKELADEIALAVSLLEL